MRRGLLLLLCVLPSVYLMGCGPIALAIEAGTAGGVLGFAEKKKEKKSNGVPLVVLTSVTREESPATITYSIFDPESNPCTLSVQYRVGSGAWSNCAPGSGGDGANGLASSPAGVPHTFSWDFVSDLGATSLQNNISVRVAANDGGQGGSASLTGLSIGNDPPSVGTILSSESAGLFLITFELADSSSDIGSMDVSFSIDQAQTWILLNPAGNDYFGNPPVNLLTNPGGLPGQFIWNSPSALPNFDGDVFLRLVPKDQPPGYSTVTEGAAVVVGPIRVSNTANTPPRLKVLTALTGSVEVGRVRVEYTLADEQSNPAEVLVEWSLNGSSYNTATLSNQTLPGVSGPFVTGPTPSRFEFVWEALVDFQAVAPNSVFLRLTPGDIAAGVPQVFGPLTVFGNRAPEVQAISVSGNSGNLQVTLNLTDGSADRVSAAFEMVIGGTPTALTSADFGGADLTNLRASRTGEDNILVWNTTLKIPAANQAAVTLRVTPTDLPSALPSAALTGRVFTSAPFAVLNTGGVTPAQVVVGASLASVNFGGVLLFNYSVLPAASSQAVIFSVVEGPAYGSITPLAPGLAQFNAPGVAPQAFRPYVTLRVASTVSPFPVGSLRVFWGTAPTSVAVTPVAQTVLLGDSLNFSAAVGPAGAPTTVSWKVVEGPGSGSIGADGIFHAPLIMPVSPTVTIRATAVNGVLGNTTLTLAQRPNRVVLTAAGSATSLALDASLQLSAQVNPFLETPQGVRWRVVFDGEDRGSGDSIVGRVSTTGLYTAPHFLPRPIKVQVEASSSALPAVSGRYTLTLNAPLPLSLDITPSAVTLTAGGRGQQFALTNLTPNNASAAVVWTRSPALGTVDTEGRYTPPATLGAQTIVLLTATSAVSGAITDTVTVTLVPPTADIPTGVTILPNTKSVPSGGTPVLFHATVAPAGAPQVVTWRVVSGAGSIDAFSGLYTPPVIALDTQVTLRATSDANGSAFADYVLCVTGSGSSWTEIATQAMGRDQPSGFYDSTNNYFWIIGGKSESSGTVHDTLAMAYDLGTNTWVRLASVGDGLLHNTLMAVLDATNNRIIAVVGDGNSPVQLFSLDLGSVVSGWTPLPAGSAANAPALPENYRYLVFMDAAAQRLVIIKDGLLSHSVYQLSTAAAAETWLAPTSVAATSGPAAPRDCAYVFNSTANRHYVIGEPGELGAATGINVWQFNVGGATFTPQAQTGSIPSGFLKKAQVAFDSVRNLALVFGGDRGTQGFDNRFWTLNLSTAGQAVWSLIATTGEVAARRACGAMMVTSQRALLYGGLDGRGAYGDLWDFNLTNLVGLGTVASTALSPVGFAPQGRRWAAGVWVSSTNEGYFYGGLTAHGESNEMWVLTYDAALATTSWLRVPPAGVQPPALAGASLVLDAPRNRLVLFGGFNVTAVSSATYAFDLNTRQWSLLTPTGVVPSARWFTAAIANPAQNRIIYYGGKQNLDSLDFTTGLAGDLRILDFSGNPNGAWVAPAVVPATLPDSRMGATLGLDASGKLWMHGGFSAASQANGQLYAFDFGSGIWSVPGVANAANQAGAFDCGTVFMTDCERFVSAPAGAAGTQALVLSTPKANWQVLQPVNSFHASGASAVFDDVNSRFIVAFGNARQYGVDSGTNSVNVIEFK